MACMFRVCGEDLDIDALLADTPLVPEGSHRRGQPQLKTKPDGKKNQNSGAAFLVSMAEFDDFETQKNGALVFLKVNRSAVQRVMNWPGVDGVRSALYLKKRDWMIEVRLITLLGTNPLLVVTRKNEKATLKRG